MGHYICDRCDGLFDSKDGECIPALDENGKETNELINEDCATPQELFAYLPGYYEDPEGLCDCDCGERKCEECGPRMSESESDLVDARKDGDV